LRNKQTAVSSQVQRLAGNWMLYGKKRESTTSHGSYVLLFSELLTADC
jgi:hypothetical protein